MKKRPRPVKTQAVKALRPPAGLPAWWMVFIPCLAVAFLVFSPALNGPFLFDDLFLPFMNPAAGSMPASFWIGGVRPILIISYWINFLVAGRDPFLYHATNILLHATAGTLVFYCGARLLAKAEVEARQIPSLAFLITSLFLLHPLQTESVDYVAGRSEVISGVFVFAAFGIFLERKSDQLSVRRTLLILVLTIGAALSKEQAAVAGIVFLLTDFFASRGDLRTIWRKSAILYSCLGVLAVGGGLLIYRMLGASRSAGFRVEGVGALQYLFTECRAIPIYLGLFVLPIRQNGDWDFYVSKGLGDHRTAFWVAGMVAAIFLLPILYRKLPWSVYGLLVFLLGLAPTSSIIPIRDALVERRMYFPIFGLLLTVAVLLAQLKLSNLHLWWIALLITILAATASWRRSAVWSNPQTFWADVVSKSPANPRAHMGLAQAYARSNRCAEVLSELTVIDGLPLRPPFGNAFHSTSSFNKSVALRCLSRVEEARISLLESIRFQPTSSAYTELGVMAGDRGDVQEAIRNFNQSITLNPKDSRTRALRGATLLGMGDHAAALRDFTAALYLDPSNRLAADNIAAARDDHRN